MRFEQGCIDSDRFVLLYLSNQTRYDFGEYTHVTLPLL